MNSTTTRLTLFAALLVTLTLAGRVRGADTPAPGLGGDLLANLQAAYNGESNANAKYLAFAAKADEEGYGQVASLFRAAARAEEVHAASHAKVIESLGAKPTKDIKTPEVKSTRENLQAAIAGESYERDEMYPAFIKNARSARNTAAARSFNLALKAEAEHAKLYRQAMDGLEQWRGGKKDFFVCTVCGWTTATLPEK